MSTSLPLPPSGRDFLAYSRIVVDAATTRIVAEELKISQTRVRQVVKRVLDWMHQSLPAHSETDDAARVNLARHIAADRLQHFYGVASRSWQQTGEMKYANLAIKVLLAQTKLPALPGTLDGLAADAILGPLDETKDYAEPDATDRGAGLWPAATPPSSPSPAPPPVAPTPNSTPSSFSIQNSAFPPPGDCSPATPISPPIAAQPAATTAITPEPQMPSAPPPSTQSAARRAFLDPAHQPFDASNATASTELRVTPQSLGFSITKPLNRSQRRRQRRLATRVLGETIKTQVCK